MEKKFVVTEGEEGGEGINEKFRISTYKLLFIN